VSIERSLLPKLYHLAYSEVSITEFKGRLEAYPKITACHFMMSSSWGAAVTPKKVLASKINS